jgi:hypothetical protein
MNIVHQPIALVCTFLWVGFVCAISFLEAWLKFKAPGVTLPIGLGIGKLVFAALNKIEWVFTIAIIASLFFNNWQWQHWHSIFIITPIVLVVLQTFWLLPALDSRAAIRIEDTELPTSKLHFYFVGMELVKVLSLLLWGIKLFKTATP